jgi:hypothetical protein
MSWFERNLGGESPQAFSKEQGRFLRAAGLDRALEVLSGPYGLRRYVVFFQRQGDRVTVTGIVSGPLAWGGGPPRRASDPEAVTQLERALTSLHRNMATGPGWERGAVGVVRDKLGRTGLFPLFDEDSDQAELEGLPAPEGPGHPLEDPAYRSLKDASEAQFAAVHMATARMGSDWVHWRLGKVAEGSTAQGRGGVTPRYGSLELTFADGRKVQRRAQALGTYDPKTVSFTWAVEQPLFAEAAYVTPDFVADWDDVFELGLLTTARLGGSWMFVGRVADSLGPLLFAAVRE